MNRRQFAKNTLMASAMVSTSSIIGFSNHISPGGTNLKKGIMWDSIKIGETILEKFQYAKQAGFDGVQVRSHLNREEVLQAREATGLIISSVCDSLHREFPFSHPDPKAREKGVEGLKVALEDAKIYDTDTVLFISGYVNERVSYDDCWNRSVAEMKKAIPTAEKLNVNIAIENVWNNFLLSPLEMARYIDEFESPMVRAFFDCGNVVEFGWPEQWINILDKRIARIHIKEYSREIAGKQGKWKGFGVKLQEGDVNWPVVVQALDSIGYTGWATIEQAGGETSEGLKGLCDSLTNILNNKK